MKLSTKIILPIILISALLILLTGCLGIVPDETPGYTPGTITGIIAAPCCSTSADPVTEPCCVSPEYWCYYCQGNWLLQDSIGVVLTYGEDVFAATTTNKDGEFTFTNVPPGKNYVITAYCPDYDDNRPLVKDVALEVASTFDTKITDLVSTSLGLVVDFLVLYTEWGPEDISLDAVIADKPTFPNFPKFKALIYEVRRVVENCEVNLLTDDDVQYATCRAAEEISKLEIGCGPGYTPPPDPCAGVPDPIADAGPDQSYEVCPGTPKDVDFDGSGSSGTGTLSYSWNFDNGAPTNDSAEQNPQNISFGEGVYNVVLTVSDDCGSATDEMIVTITEYAGPTADAGGPYEGSAETTVDVGLDGSGSFGGDTPIVTYDWDFGDGFTADNAGVTPSHDYAPGNYTVTLTVTDENGCTDTDTAEVTVHQKTTETEKFMIAFEDLPIESANDWDYNDFVGEINITYHFWSPDKLEGIDFTSIIHKARSAGHNHEVHVIIDGYITDPEHTYSATNCTPTIANTNDFHLFDPTDGTVTNTYGLNIDFGDKPVPWVYFAIDWSKIHGDNDLPFEFYLYDAESGGDFKIENGDIRKLVVPDTWTIPASTVAIWDVYANVIENPADMPDFSGEDGTWTTP